MKVQADACTLLKKNTLAQLFSCEYSEIFKDTLFIEQLSTTVSATTVISFFFPWFDLPISYEKLN